jgi:tRNA (guanine37-N1)-methyltransferase
MRLDIVTIFPEFFSVLDVSLLGKARAAELVQANVHDLREWAAIRADGAPDVHRTVDDSPFGGGAGMVMKADVWGKALDDVLEPGGVLVVPTPAGVPFTQALALDLATAPQLVFACGRYEGIDARVPEHYAAAGFRVLEVSLGDYVLNGGEVAAFAMIEAVTRLIPGFMGNAQSIVEESHADGLLEYPSYTRPASWRGLDVPDVLMSGHHGKIEKWRREQSERRTRERRPDLLRPDLLGPDLLGPDLLGPNRGATRGQDVAE